ncbi:MAG TPA: DUF3109 family protein [Gemmatimonadaceae bacterium]|jgi:Fe-S-cluster containining protein|nr:DUF3109 family protein [Gemmatimonadaceae bacterium]
MTDTRPTLRTTHVIREHHLPHAGPLPVDEDVFTCRFSEGCSMMNCRATCCSDGVWVDLAHRDRVLAEAPLVIRYMDAEQEHDPSKWFCDDAKPDIDFPSGIATSTQVVNEACVFLNARGWCVLHMAEAESPGLKPFYCRTYPLVLLNHVVTIDQEACATQTHCCGAVEDGPLTLFDVCGDEIEYLLGERGASDLRRAAGADREGSA